MGEKTYNKVAHKFWDNFIRPREWKNTFFKWKLTEVNPNIYANAKNDSYKT